MYRALRTSPDFIVSAMNRESDDHDPVTMGSFGEPPWMIPLEVASKSHSRAKLQSREHEKESSFWLSGLHRRLDISLLRCPSSRLFSSTIGSVDDDTAAVKLESALVHDSIRLDVSHSPITGSQ